MEKQSNKVSIFKIVVIGEQRVGKTSIAKNFVEGNFDMNSESTVDACCLQKYSNAVHMGIKSRIQDTAGQQKYNAIVPVYYRDALGAIIVYQITTKQSFIKVKKWIKELKEYGKKGIVIMVVGNKIDLKSQRKVSYAEAELYCQSQNVQFAEVSAKTGQGINYLFQNMAERINESNSMQSSMVFKGSRGRSRISLSSEEQKPKKSRCCL